MSVDKNEFDFRILSDDLKEELRGPHPPLPGLYPPSCFMSTTSTMKKCTRCIAMHNSDYKMCQKCRDYHKEKVRKGRLEAKIKENPLLNVSPLPTTSSIDVIQFISTMYPGIYNGKFGLAGSHYNRDFVITIEIKSRRNQSSSESSAGGSPSSD